MQVTHSLGGRRSRGAKRIIMGFTINKITVTKETLLHIRKPYLEELAFAQEYYLELVIPTCNIFSIESNHENIGYAIITVDSTLIEFYLVPRYRKNSKEIFSFIVSQNNIHNILCKSFDYSLLNCCVSNGYTYTVDGLMFRNKLEDLVFIEDKAINVSFATNEHIPFFKQQNDEVFEPKELLEEAIKNKTIIVFENNKSIIGCGFVNIVYLNSNYCDIGVWVEQNNRKKGYGSYIMKYLSNSCKAKQLIPVCGCGVDNIISQKTLSKCGYYSEFSLLNFRTNFA